MALSFEQNPSTLNEEVYTPIKDATHLWYNEYEDSNISEIDELKNIKLDSSQINLTQEENSQYIPFRMDRYYDGIDLSKMNIQIHYVNLHGFEDIISAVNVQYSDTKIKFGWLVGKNVTAVAGDITFEIIATGSNEKGESYVWKTRPNGKLNVIKSLAGNGMIEPSDDWYKQFVADMNQKVGEAKVASTEAKTAAEEAKQAAADIKDSIGTMVEEKLDEAIDNKLAEYATDTEVQSAITSALEVYYTKTEVDNIVASIDISDQLVDINNKIDNIDGLKNFNVEYDPDTGVMTFYNGTEVIKGIDIGSVDPSAEWEAAYDEKMDGKIADAIAPVNTVLDEYKTSNDAEIAQIKTDVGNANTEVGKIKNEMVNLSSEVTAATEAVNEVKGGMDGINSAITEIQNEIEELTPNVYEATYGTTEEGVENTFILWENGEVKSQFVIAGGGGGGGTPATTLKVERITESPLIVTSTDKVEIQFNCTSTDSDGESVDCSYTWKLGGAVIASGPLAQGFNSFDMSKYVSVGTHKFTLTVSDEGGSVAVKTWTVQVIDVRIKSAFNDTLTYEANKPVSFSYTPYGAIQKTVHFILDGVELESVTTGASGLLQSYTLPAQEHGAHLLECYITANINGIDIETEHIYKDIIWYDAASTVPVIGCIYRNDYYGNVAARQYNATAIKYVVYDPNTSTPTINKTVDGVDAGSLVLESNVDTWSYKTSDIGAKTLGISCGVTSVGIVLDVAELDIDVEPITANLEFDFNPVGHSNTGDNRLWADATNPEVTMSVSDNFDWVNGGYQLDENNDQYFCVKSGTTATINYNLFADDPKKNGKEFKVVFKTTNVRKRDSAFLSCLDGNIGLNMKVEGASINSSNDGLNVLYCEDDIIEFEFNVNKDTEIPMVLTYEDGVANRPMIYTADSSFMQLKPVPITIGSPDCDVYIYRMKAYSAGLTDSEILSNFIADARNADEIIARYNRNQIYNENGVLTPEVLAERCPDLRIIKIDAPWFTNDKKDKVTGTTIQMIYKGGDSVLDNWTAYNCQHSGQGTSSNEYGYAGRNMDLIMNKSGLDDGTKPRIVLGDGSETNKVALTRNSVPTNYFNVKVNIASSENQNNAQFARRYNEYNPYVRPAKINDPKVKDCMEFYNCVVFIRENNPDISTHREFNDNEWHYYALGNIGDSKKTDDTRVNDPDDPMECILEIMDYNLPLSEFPKGEEALAILDADNFDEKGTYGWRYCYDEDNTAEINEKWREFYRFVVNSTDEEFHNNLKDYFVVESALYYYLFTERYTMVDNRAKNLFFHYGKCEDGVYRWDVAFAYDMDTSIGIDNVGKLVLPYGKEDTDYYVDGDPSSSYIYRAAESTFFCRLRDLFKSEMKDMFVDRESAGAWSSNSLITQWDTAQSQFPEEIWRLDIQRKYLRTYQGISIDNSKPGAATPRFLVEMLNGRKKYQRRQFERNQEMYMATKYFGTVATSNQIMMRFNNPVGAAVPQDFTLHITPYANMYIAAKYGNVEPINFRAKAGVEYDIPYPIESNTADITLIYGAPFIQAIGDLSKCYVGDNDFSKATRLQRLVIGSDVPGYSNTYMTQLTLGNNKLMEYLDIQNIPNLKSVIDLSQCNNMLELHAEGSGATGVIFANGGKIQKAYIPAVTSLTMKNLDFIEVFDVDSYDNLQTLTIENTPSINSYEVVDSAPILDTLRLIGIDWNSEYNIEDTAILNRMLLMRGIDSFGYTIDKSVVTGSFYAAVVKEKELEKYNKQWAELEIGYNTLVNQFSVTFQNDDGTILDVQYVDKGSKAVDPITRADNPIPVPTKVSSVSTDFTFKGWDSAFIPAFSNQVITATYTESLRKYTVKYMSKNNILQETKAEYGSIVLYNGEIPTYTMEEGAYKYYLFDGWDKSGYVNGDKTIRAVYDSCEYVEGYFDGKELFEMRPVEIYAMIKLGLESKYVESKDPIAIELGNDISYDDIEEKVLISQETRFDGTNYIDTNEALLAEDRDFVIAIDYSFDSNNTNNGVMAQCFSGSNMSGFRLLYNNGAKVGWGTSSTSALAENNVREMVVLRHIKGENGIHVYMSNTNSDKSAYVELNGSHAMMHNGSIVFGCSKADDGAYENYAKGTVYWSKVWYADLGDDACKQIAYWPHEDIELEMCGFKRYYLSDDPSKRSSMSFLASTPLSKKMKMNNSQSTTGGFANYTLNGYLNGRIYDAFPYRWKQLMKRVKVNSSIGDKSMDISSSACYIFVPCVSELNPSETSNPYILEGTAIDYMSTNDARILRDKNGVAVTYYTRSPNASYTNYIYTVSPTGTLNGFNYADAEHHIRIMISM